MEYSYYGNMQSVKVNFDGKVHYMMIDEKMKKILEKNEEIFKMNLKEWMDAYRKECISSSNAINKKINNVNAKLIKIENILKSQLELITSKSISDEMK